MLEGRDSFAPTKDNSGVTKDKSGLMKDKKCLFFVFCLGILCLTKDKNARKTVYQSPETRVFSYS